MFVLTDVAQAYYLSAKEGRLSSDPLGLLSAAEQHRFILVDPHLNTSGSTMPSQLR